jgi:hypothetical protein
MLLINILKRNRKYFAIEINGYKCKLLIDENSQKLELGEQVLLVDDISVKTKFGTDVIYKLKYEAELQTGIGICTLKHDFYNHDLIDKCRKLGGTWDNGTWVFKNFVADEVEDLDYLYNSALKSYELKFLNGISSEKSAITVFGMDLVAATGKCSGATLKNGAALIEGSIKSGGSHANWNTQISRGSIIRVAIPSGLVEEFLLSEIDETDHDFTIKCLD